MRYKVTIAYDGRNYAGFQSQINALAIQDVIEGALFRIFSEKIRIIMSSRTDAGVHAKGQVFHFDSDKEKEPGKLKYSINSLLPDDIHVNKVEIVSKDFHARFSVKKKTYEYLINTGEYDVFLKGYAYQCFYPLDVEKMREAAQYLVGEHDFKSFCSIHTQAQTTTRTITEIEVIERPCEEEQTAERVAAMIPPFDMENDGGTDPGQARRTVSPREIVIRVSGTGFLYNMVRIIAGTLMEAGRGALAPEQIKVILNARDRSKAGPTAPPEGLTLVRYRILNGNSDKNMKKINN